MSKIIKLFFIVIFIKNITWSLFIPLWHFPDEQSHFGHVAYLAEGGQIPMGRSQDLTEEIAISEQLLGTYRDKYGNNQFTFHPEYRLDYTNAFDGQHEQEIKNLPLSSRSKFTDAESAYYPHFFYRISGLIYKLFYSQNLFIRVFALRLFWLFSYVLLIWLAYKIGQLIFPKSQFLAIAVATLTGFQPMLTFVSAGITSDNLHNLLFTALIYFCLKIWQKLDWYNLIGLVIVIILGIITKPQFLISLGIALPVLLIKLLKAKEYKLIGILSITITGLLPFFTQGRIPHFEAKAILAHPDYSLWQHIKFTLQHTFKEVLPWYWGVFRWLSLVLPRWVNQVMMRLLLVSGIGFAIKLIKWLKNKTKSSLEPGLGIIIWSALIYFLALLIWDFQHIRNSGFSFGIQGRYYFPTIVPHMVLLIIGLKSITKYLVFIVSFWFILLSWIGFYTVTSSYFDTSSFNLFILQASQYKPFFAKNWWLISTLLLYLLTSLIFSYKLFKVFQHEK